MSNDEPFEQLIDTLTQTLIRRAEERRKKSPQNALWLTLSAMDIDPDDADEVRKWYEETWDKDGNEARLEGDFERFWCWLEEEETEQGNPRRIYASSLVEIEDSLEPKWKAYYFFIRTWGMSPVD